MEKIFKWGFWKLFIILFAAISFSYAINSFFKIFKSVAPDYSVLYQSTVDILSDKNPYTDNSLVFQLFLPPIITVFYLPFSVFNFNFSLILFSIFSFFSLLGSIYISFKIIFKKVKIYSFLFASSLAIISFPTKFTFGMGQVNLISLLLLLISFYFYNNKKNALSGFFFAISVISKPTFAIFGLYYLLKKSWRVILSALITLFFAFILSIGIGGIGNYYYWFNNILPLFISSQGKEVYYNQGFSGFISRFVFNLQLRQYFTYAFFVGLMSLTTHLSIRNKDENVSFALFIVTLLMIDPLSWQHHFVWLIFPFISAIKHALEYKKMFIWLLIVVAYLLVSWNFKNPSQFFNFPANFVLSNMFYGSLILYLLLSISIRRN